MNTKRTHHPLAGLLLAAACALASGAAHAQANIDQNKVLAGNVTPGDAPGFPLTISQPGSYKLTSNLYVPADTTGVLITAANVTLDLNGFTIQGPNSCTREESTKVVSCTITNDKHGIDSRGGHGLHLLNGTVKGFGGTAVFGGDHNRYDNLRLTESSAGLNDLSDASIVHHVLADLNRKWGISVNGGVVANCVARNNGEMGFAGSAFTLLSESAAIKNRGVGVYSVSARGVSSWYNGASNNANYDSVKSMGGNLSNSNPF